MNVEQGWVAILEFLYNLSRVTVPDATNNWSGQGQHKQPRNDVECESVHGPFEVTLLHLAVKGVHHNSCILARVSDEADDPLCVRQLSTFE